MNYACPSDKPYMTTKKILPPTQNCKFIVIIKYGKEDKCNIDD